MLRGVNLEATLALARAVSLPVIASGGVASLDDLAALAAVASEGIEGVVIGRALYDGRIDAVSAPGRGAAFKVTLPVVPYERSIGR